MVGRGGRGVGMGANAYIVAQNVVRDGRLVDGGVLVRAEMLQRILRDAFGGRVVFVAQYQSVGM